MAETAAHLVDHVIPRVPVRQWVLSFPIPLRLLLAAHPHLLSPVLSVVNRGRLNLPHCGRAPGWTKSVDVTNRAQHFGVQYTRYHTTLCQ